MSDAPTRTGAEPGEATDAGVRLTSSGDALRTQAGSQTRDGNGQKTPPPAADPGPSRARALALPVAAGVVLLLLVAAVVYWRTNIGLVKTDNAQTSGDVAPVSSQITGTVVKIDVSDNQYVKTGTVLVELDPMDYRLALNQARANRAADEAQVNAAQAALAAQEQQFTTGVSAARGALAATVPSLPQSMAQLQMVDQTTAAQIEQAQAGVTTAQANVQSSKANYDTANKTLNRDRQLLTQGAIAQQQVDSDTAAYETALAQMRAAEDSLRQARASLASAHANRQQVTVTQNTIAINRGQITQAQANVQQAQAGDALVRQRAEQLAVARAQAAQASEQVRTAQVNLDRTLIRAPVDGWVTNRTVQIGSVVQTNQPLMAVAVDHHLWVIANVKETQLGNVRPGNPVRVTVDTYRGKVFHGHVISINAATGSTTALLPPDNATGNFVKVVQLVPVWIALDPGEFPAGRQLPIGLSAEVTIDTRHVDQTSSPDP
ncbi:MAG TPA: HlyD family secretion protein [bacterium]|nr:HlyD family secretion protein [bacterium]